MFLVSVWGEVVITQNIAETQSLQFMMADIRRCLEKQEGLRQQKSSLKAKKAKRNMTEKSLALGTRVCHASPVPLLL